MRDGLLLGLGVIGLVVYFGLLRAHHPDAAADYRLGEAGAERAAAAALADLGYSTGDLDAEVSFLRLPHLLDTLQMRLGRTETVEALRAGGLERLPAYYWRVAWYRPPPPGDEAQERIYTVNLGPDGALWGFSYQAEEPILDRAAVAAAEAPGREEGLAPVLTDSLLTAVLAYHPDDSLWAAGPSGESSSLKIAESVERVRALQASGVRGFTPDAFAPRSTGDATGRTVLSYSDLSVELTSIQAGPNWAEALARYHLGNTYLAGYTFRVDSTYLVRSASGAREFAAVRLVAEEPYLGVRPSTTLRVAATGALVGMETAFVAEPPVVGGEEEVAEEDGISVSAVGGVGEGVVYVLIVLILLAVFFRRLGARLLDTRMALRDAMWGGFFVALLIVSMVGYEFMDEIDEPLLALLAAVLVGVLVGLSAFLLVLFMSSAADSMGRDVWPAKLDALQLVREASLLNAPVGRALLRGTALGFVLLGLLTLVLTVLPSVPVPFDDADEFLSGMTLTPVGYVFGTSAFRALFVVLGVLLGLGGLLRQRWSAERVLPLLVVVFALVNAGPLALGSTWANWALGALVGAVVVGTFWRVGALTCFVCLLVVELVWGLSPGWLVAGGPEVLDVVLGLGGVGLMLALGTAGVLNGREAGDLQRYVPAYITELAQKERMGRELEIAHQVQEFFLPRRMPEVEGVDVAAMCLAAQEVGGDYYDFIDLGGGRLGVAVGDVSGKGIQAAFFMTLTKGFLQTLARSEHAPAEVLRRLNALFRENAPRGLFVSMIYGVLDVEARVFTFARAGHNPLIVTRSPNQEANLVQPAGLAIGLTSGRAFDDVICEETIHLRPGDTLVFYTDGFSEAMNAARMQYGDDRLARKVSDVSRRSANEILRAVTEDVHHFVEAVGRHDDMTMVVLKLARRTDSVASRVIGRGEERPAALRPPVLAG